MRLSDLYVGEIVESIEPSDPRNLNKVRYEYSVRIFMNTSSVSVVNNAILLEPLSGVDNFHEVVLRSSFDDGGKGMTYESSPQDMQRRSGDSVIVAFVNGESSAPIIIGSLPNPTFLPVDNKDKFESLPVFSKSEKPQLRGRYNGFHYRIDEAGQVRLQHTGAAKIKIDQGLFVEAEDEDPSSITTLDFLSKGDWRLVDSSNQGVVINAQQKYLSISNTIAAPDQYFGPILPPEIAEKNDQQQPLGQEIRLDKANEDLSLLTSKTFKLIVGTDSLTKVFGDVQTQVTGNDTKLVNKDQKETTGKSRVIEVGSTLVTIVKKTITIQSKGGSIVKINEDGTIDITGTTVNINADDVNIGNSPSFSAVLAEKLVDVFNAHTHATVLGPTGTPLPIPAAMSASGLLADPGNIASGTVKLKI